ncbi:laminin subunit beta-1 [Belonocnema kinseyi]|uniref:laminin subunit beta-1 n=1 Tax=Belonocnema kinseyi TaxID=2817044 RepID=UPI00143DAB39|nr:laminin subunit beta-1 [Belonocnema kinseyi]
MVGFRRYLLAANIFFFTTIFLPALADPQYGQSRAPVRGLRSIQRGDMSPYETFGENHDSPWPIETITRGAQQKRIHPCEQSSCYPATGNLLVGRANRLQASSTCGLRDAERYCIVSHLKDRKKCFYCEASNPKRQHGIENIINGAPHRTWWQAENGVENVTIRFDLEAEFHFTHIIIRFQTFRPAAMLIERSYNFGKTWQVYRYFAHNCEHYFPGIPTHMPQKLTDVICETRYSHVAPSKNGDLIFRVLPSNLLISNPYSKEVQNLLKMTNLRINFTKLHTLGDDLLDNRAEIREKYYYAINDMVIRGSCSCYGHASRCLPLPGVDNEENMVHGRCECTHNTKGLNCELCEDFYNDLPWKPAVGKQTNTCRKCNCNNHATSCHFDEAVYERSGKVSGGVCDNCQHNTRGQNCEQCALYFYHDESKDISDPEACQPCECDPRGSLDEGICDSRTDPLSGEESGRCHCKPNVQGRHCNECKNGYWNFDSNNPDGCQACTCDTLGTIDNEGCDVLTGDCTCKRYVTGPDCNQCLPDYYGLSEDVDGCKPCECDPGGSLESSCDVVTGQCRCRSHVSGRTCNQPEQSYYTGYIDLLTYEGELARGTDNCQVVIREPYRDGRNSTWTGTGFMKALEGSTLNFTVGDIYRSMWYDIIVRYEPVHPGTWNDVQIVVERHEPVNPNGPCAEWKPDDDRLWTQLPANSRSAEAIPPICLEAGKQYNILLTLTQFVGPADTPSASILVDSIVLRPNIDYIPFFNGSGLAELRRQEYESYRCNDFFNNVGYRQDAPDACSKHYNSIGYYVYDGAHLCECNPTGSHSAFCEISGGRCYCKTNVVGRRCDLCAPGTYGFGPEGCKACDCDGVGALDNFCDAETDVICECREGYSGPRCDSCAENYYGNPEVPGGSCSACDCSNNTDIYRPGNCDPHTGRCLQCLYNTAGPNCQICKPDYFGNALFKDCQPCGCDVLGTDRDVGSCDHRTGQCPCLPHVIGKLCNACEENHWKIASGQGCDPCECDLVGSVSDKCNPFDGTCECRAGFGGRRCNECQANHWGNPNVECYRCDCDQIGSASPQCNRETGACVCHKGIGGPKCDQCDRSYIGYAPNCSPCGECFDNWDMILDGLRNKTDYVIAEASNIQKVGTTGVYSQEFDDMVNSIEQVKTLLGNATIRSQDLDELNKLAEDLNKNVSATAENLLRADELLNNVKQRVNINDVALKTLKNKTNSLNEQATNLKENATFLQEGNVQGALNVTRLMAAQSQQAEKMANDTTNILDNADKYKKHTESLIAKNSDAVVQALAKNKESLENLREKLGSFTEVIPELNLNMCGQNATECGSVCGGAGCDTCGGLSCDAGAKTKATQALDVAKKQSTKIKNYKDEAEQLLRSMNQVKSDATSARSNAQDAFNFASDARNRSDDLARNISDLADKIGSLLDQNQNQDHTTPAQVRTLAEEVIAKNIPLKPEEIRELADKIKQIVGSLTNSDTILADTKDDLDRVLELKAQANRTKEAALEKQNLASKVGDLLNEAKEAQDLADSAIEKANKDITLSEKDLTEIIEVTSEAKKRADNTKNSVNALEDRLNILLSHAGRNEFIVKEEIAIQGAKVGEEAKVVENKTYQLGEKYKQASDTLNERVDKSKANIQRAKRLLQQASELTADTSTKFKDLNGMESVYKDNERILSGLMADVDAMNEEMNHQLKDIEKKSQAYRQCST